MEEDKDWTKAELKDYHIYRKGIWVLKEEVQQIQGQPLDSI